MEPVFIALLSGASSACAVFLCRLYVKEKRKKEHQQILNNIEFAYGSPFIN